MAQANLETSFLRRWVKKLSLKTVGILAPVILSLVLNVATGVRIGVESWFSTIFNEGTLVVEWVGSDPPYDAYVRVNPATDDTNSRMTVRVSLGRETSLPRGSYTVAVAQSVTRDVPTRLRNRETGHPILSPVQIRRWQTLHLTAEPLTTSDPTFATVYDGRLQMELGRPLQKTRLLSQVHETFLERGRILWLADTNSFFVLDVNGWEEVQDVSTSRSPCLYDQACVDKEQNVPDGLHAPIGGALEIWKIYKKQHADPIGWATGKCSFYNAIYLEEFENGRLIGPLPTSAANDSTVQILALLKDGDRKYWRGPLALGVTPKPRCKER